MLATSPILGQRSAANNRSISHATTEDVRSYLAALVRRHFAPSSSARRLSAIKQLFRFLTPKGAGAMIHPR